MSKITNDSLTRSGTGCSLKLYPYGNSGHQRDIQTHTQTDIETFTYDELGQLSRQRSRVSQRHVVETRR